MPGPARTTNRPARPTRPAASDRAEQTTRSTRNRPAKAPLSFDAVVDAALAILRAEGAEAVTMRRVAAALDTGPGSLYVYVSGREALLHALHERVVSSIRTEKPNPARWRTQLHTLLRRMRAALEAHPGLAGETMIEPPATESSIAVVENLFGILLAGGVGVQDAAWAADIFGALVTYAAIETEQRKHETRDLAKDLHAAFTALPADRFPLLTTYAAEMVAGDGDDRFRFWVDVVVDGLIARSPRG